MKRHLLLWLPLALTLLAACGPQASSRPTRAPGAQAPDRMRPSGVTVVPAPAAVGSAPERDPRSLGDPGAPITVVEYSDFQ